MEEQKKDVTPESSPDTGSQPAPEVVELAEELQPQKPPKGFVPYQALEEERRKRKELEEKLATLAPSEEPENNEVFSDEGKILRGDIRSLGDKLRSIEKKESRREVESEFPILKERKEEFDSFLEDEENKRISIRKVAQLFLAQQNLLVQQPKRLGLEKPTGGGQVVPEPKISNEEAEEIRKKDYRKYEQLIRAGKI